MTILEFFETVYSPLKLRGRSENTRRLYRCTISSFKKFLKRDPALSDLTDLTLARFLTYRASIRSGFTAEKERTQLCSLSRFAFERRMIEVNPCVPPAPLPERIPSAWTVDQLRSLMAACGRQKGFIGKTPAASYYSALVAVLWESAERIGAILECQVADYGGGQLYVRAEYRKGKKRDKIYDLTPATRLLLDAAIRGKRPRDKIFAWDRPYSMLWYAFGKVVESAGLPGGRRAKFHQLRRSAATHYEAAGGDATSFLDHSSRRITRAYLDPRFLKSGPAPCDVLPSIN